jgi:WD40 repeat protein/energy-coupling factor transporter ATP-binding protein EcfA2
MAKYALVIGIPEYQSFAPLVNTTTDAEAIAQILETQGNFQAVKRLPEGWNAAKSCYEIAQQSLTGKELGAALKTFLLEQATQSDALIYFTGHGFTISDNLGQQSGYLATSDCRVDWDGNRAVNQCNGISLDSLNGLIQQASLSSLVLLLDCCHSGFFIEQTVINQTLTALAQKDYYLITSSRSFESSWSGEEHSIFSGALLGSLVRGNAGSDGQVTVDRVFDFIQRQLRNSGQEPVRLGWGRSITLVTYSTLQPESEESEFNRQNPYLGLQAFEDSNAAYFYGRETAIYALIERLNKGRFLSVIGASGCGKSSLVKAGLLPKLKDDPLPESRHWTIAQFTPGDRPLSRLLDILAPLHSQNKPFLVFIDQFEEVFTQCKDEAQRCAFFRLMADEVTTVERQGRVIVAIRGDFLDRCAEYTEIAALINRTQPTTYFVEPLAIEGLHAAIVEPAKQHGVSLEAGIAEKMAEDVAHQPGALPLLQYALRELWRTCIEETESPQPCLTWAGYEQIGEVGGALEKRANLIYNSFSSDSDRDLVRRLSLELVELGHGNIAMRRRANRESLDAIADSPEQLQMVLDRLSQERLIVITTEKVSETTFENYIEVTHEALLSKWDLLKAWIEQNRDNIRLKRRFEADFLTWRDRYQQSEEALLTGLWLSDIVAWKQKEKPRLLPAEHQFIEQSIARRDHEFQDKLNQERRLREEAEARAKAEAEKAKEAEARAKMQRSRFRIAIVSSVGLLFLTLAAGYQWLQAERGQILALAQASQASFNLNRDSFDALLLAIQAGRKLQKIDFLPGSTEVREAVMTALPSALYWVKEQNRLEGHTNYVQSVSFSPDGTLVASSSYDKTIKIWSIFSKKVTTLQGYKHTIWDVSFSPNNQFLISASGDKEVRLWNLAKNSFQPFKAHNAPVSSASFSPDGKVFITADIDGLMILWNLQNISYPKKIESRNGGIRQIRFNTNPNYCQFAETSTKEGKLTLWNCEEFELQKATIQANLSDVYSFSFDPNADRLVTSSRNGVISIFRLNGQLIQHLQQAQEAFATSVNFSIDGQIIAASMSNGDLKVWDRSGNFIQGFQAHNTRANSISFNSSGLLASASDDKTVKVWQLTSPLFKSTVSNAHQKSVRYVSFNPDGNLIATASIDGTAHIWNRQGNLAATLSAHTKAVDEAIFSRDGKLIATASRDGTINLWDTQQILASQGNTEPIIKILNNGKSGVIVFHPDPQKHLLIISDSEGVIYFFDYGINRDTNIVKSDSLPKIKAHDANILRLAFSPDGQILATASDDTTVKLWHKINNQWQSSITLQGHTGGIEDIKFSHDGKTIATASKDNTAKLWTTQGKLLKTFKGHKAIVTSVSFSNNDRILVTSSDDRTIKLWNSKGKLLATIQGHTAEVNSVIFDPKDNKKIISVSSDNSMTFWTVEAVDLSQLLETGCDWLKYQEAKKYCS